MNNRHQLYKKYRDMVARNQWDFFVPKLTAPNLNSGSTDAINDYNAAQNILVNNLRKHSPGNDNTLEFVRKKNPAQTESIIDIYNFFKNNHQLFLNLQIHSHQLLVTENNKKISTLSLLWNRIWNQKKYQTLLEEKRKKHASITTLKTTLKQVKNLLNTSKNFCAWAEQIVPAFSLRRDDIGLSANKHSISREKLDSANIRLSMEKSISLDPRNANEIDMDLNDQNTTFTKYFSFCESLEKLVDPTQEKIIANNGKCTYVMDLEDNLFIYQNNQKNAGNNLYLREVTRESIMRKKAVADATVVFNNNKIVSISMISSTLKTTLKQVKNKFHNRAKNFRVWAAQNILAYSFPKEKEIASFPDSSDKKSLPQVNMEFDVNADFSAFNNNTGLKLLPHAKRVKLDPQHRSWNSNELSAQIHNDWAQDKSEDFTVHLEFNENLKHQTPAYIKYFTFDESLQHLVTVSTGSVDGQLAYGNDGIVKDGKYIYVMDTQGNLFIHKAEEEKFLENDITNKLSLKEITHASLVRGKAVAGAGELVINNGKIISLNNQCKDYQTGPYSLYRVAKALQKRGATPGFCQIIDKTNTIPQQIMNEKKVSRPINVDEYEHNLSLYTNEQKMLVNNAENNSKKICELSEKTNIQKLFISLSNINLYLKERARKTSRIGSKFNIYSAKDYYDRRDTMSSVLDLLQQGSMHKVTEFIDAYLKDKDCKKSNFARLLHALNSTLKAQHAQTLAIDEVKARINTYKKLYDSMELYTESAGKLRASYKLGLGIFKHHTDYIITAKTNYDDALNKLDKNIQNEFTDSKDLLDVEYNNLRYGK